MFMKAFYCFYYSFISSKLVRKYMKNKIGRPQIFSLIVYKISFFGGSS
jgi:sulfur relay (sulfurtransferase) DsrC/TusE family protein